MYIPLDLEFAHCAISLPVCLDPTLRLIVTSPPQDRDTDPTNADKGDFLPLSVCSLACRVLVGEREAPVPVNAHPFAALCVLEGRGERERKGGRGRS